MDGWIHGIVCLSLCGWYVLSIHITLHIDGYWWVSGCGYTLHAHYQLLAAERPLEGLHKVR